MAGTVKTAEGDGRGGDGLLGSPAGRSSRLQPVRVITQESPRAGLSGPGRCLLSLETVIESPKRPTMVAGRSPYRKSRREAHRPSWSVRARRRVLDRAANHHPRSPSTYGVPASISCQNPPEKRPFRLHPPHSYLPPSVASRKPFVYAVERGLIIHELSFSSGKSGLKIAYPPGLGLVKAQSCWNQHGVARETTPAPPENFPLRRIPRRERPGLPQASPGSMLARPGRTGYCFPPRIISLARNTF